MAGKEIVFDLEARDALKRGVDTLANARITSYNVCYTKLLRLLESGKFRQIFLIRLFVDDIIL